MERKQELKKKHNFFTLDPNQNEKCADLLMELHPSEFKFVGSEFERIGMKYSGPDAKFTFEQFLEAMKDSKVMNELILKISDV